MADDVTAILAAVKEHIALAAAADLDADALNEVYAALVQLACVDSPLLVAAVEAVLKAADDFDFEASRQERGAGLSAASGGMIIPAGQRGRADTHRDCARTLREAITAALTGTGKEGSDE